MKIETQPRDDHQVTLIVEIEPDQMTGAKRRAARRISERRSIPGFRPGKAPYEVVVRSFGEGAVTEEAVDILLDEVYPKAIEEAKIEPGAQGSLEKVEDVETTPKFTFNVPLAPTADLGDYRSIRETYDWQEPGEDKVDESLEEMRQMYAKTETVERPIQKGDFVMIDLKGEKKGAEEGEAPLIDRPSLPVFVRPDEKPTEFPFPGFSNELVGLGLNESKTFTHKFEKDNKDETLAGQTVKFTVNVKMIRGSTLPELDDAFAKMVGPFETLQALREAIKANLATQSKAEYDDEYFTKIMDKIKAGAKLGYPPQMVDHELEHVMEDLKQRLAAQNLDLAAYLKSRQMEEEKFVAAEARPIAIKRLERALIMDELAKNEKIEVSQEQLQSTFQQTWSEYSNDAAFQKQLEGKKQPPQQLMNAVAMDAANRAYVQLTLNRLKDIATGKAEELPAEADSEEKPAAKKSTTKKSTGAKSTAAKAKKPAAEKKAATTKKTSTSKKTTAKKSAEVKQEK